MADIGLDMLTLLSAVNSDPEKQKRLEELQAQLQAQKDVLDSVVAERTRLDVTAEGARQDRAAAEAAQRDVAQREQKLREDTEALASVTQSHRDEMAQYALTRDQIEAGLKDRAGKIVAEEERQTQKHAELTQREAAVEAREAAVGVSEAMLVRRHAALQQAMQTQ